MSDLISRQDAIKTIKDADVFVAYHEKDPIEEAIDEAIRATKRSVIYDIGILPSAETDLSTYSDKLWKNAYERGKAEGRKKGKWIYGEKSGQDGWYCSECGGFIPWYYDFYGLDNIDFIEDFKTCPFCDSKMVSYTGADMRGEQDE